MEGAKWEAADWAAKKFLSDLGKDDRFDVAFFHNDIFLHSKKMLAASPKNVADAVKFVTENRSSGGTELGTALERMLMVPKITPGKKLSRQLLVITDAEVTDEGRILELARRESESDARRRISVLCIDASPNSTLTNRLAERGGGTAAYLTSDPGAEDVTTAVDEILSRWSRPVAESVVLEIDAKALRIAGKKTTIEAGCLKAELGSLMGGEPLWVVGKISGFNSKSSVRVCFDELAVDAAVTPIKKAGKGGAIRSLFGARQIQELEFLKSSWLTGLELQNELSSLGYETQIKKGKVYEKNEKEAAQAALDALLLEESLKYGVVSSCTALVASRTEKGKLVDGTVLTPNALPYGWYEEILAFSAPARSFVPSAGGGAPLMLKKKSMGVSYKMQFHNIPNLLMADSPAASLEPESKVTTIYDAAVKLQAGEELTLSEISGAGRLSALSLSEESLTSLIGEILEGLTLRIYADGGTRPSARVKLADLVKLGGNRPLNIYYTQSARFVMVNDGGKTVTLKKLSVFVS
jgi:Ca-activated chloride channel family protein